MSNWGNGNGGGPVYAFWKVMLVVLGVIAVSWLLTILFFGEGNAP